MKEMVFNFWQYRPFGKQDMKQAVKDWKDGGFNVATSFVFEPGMNPQDMIDLLDECLSNELKLILFDTRISYARLKKIGEDEYRKAVFESVKQFGSHPAAYAYFLGDEPNRWIMDIARKGTKIVNEISPIPAFVNFNPVWRSKDFNALIGIDADEIDKLYIPFIKETKMPILAYDCYSSMISREDYEATSKNFHFYNLNVFHSIAKAANVPLWTSLLCTGHWQYKLPSLNDMRWMASTCIAHGVQGVQWFELYSGASMGWDSPIDRYNERQPSYYDMRKVNREFRDCVGELIPNLELVEVLHYNRIYGNTRPWADGYDEYLKRFTARYSDDAIISKFRHKETGRIWYMLVNASMKDGNRFTYQFTEEYKHLNGEVWLRPGLFKLIELNK